MSSIPNKSDRDKLLQEFKKTRAWDELKKDIFYMDLKSKTSQELSKKYPELTPQELKELQSKRR